MFCNYRKMFLLNFFFFQSASPSRCLIVLTVQQEKQPCSPGENFPFLIPDTAHLLVCTPNAGVAPAWGKAENLKFLSYSPVGGRGPTT